VNRGLLPRAAFALAVLANACVLYWPRAVGQGGVPYADKAVHVAIFAVVAATGVWARLPVAWLAGLLAVHAVSSELAQHWWLSQRSGDPADVAADLVGIALGLALGLKFTRRSGDVTTGSGGSWSA
jgi:hypothetical protein